MLESNGRVIAHSPTFTLMLRDGGRLLKRYEVVKLVRGIAVVWKAENRLARRQRRCLACIESVEGMMRGAKESRWLGYLEATLRGLGFHARPKLRNEGEGS
jgi:hypothetical protein